MTLDRRNVLSAGLLASATAAGVATVGVRSTEARSYGAAGQGNDIGLVSGSQVDQAPVLQMALDTATDRGAPLHLPPGHFRIGGLRLRSGARLICADGLTRLEHTGSGPFITAEDAASIAIEGIAVDGAYAALGDAEGLIAITRCRSVQLHHLHVTRSPGNGIALFASGGSVTDCTIDNAMQAAVRSLDATGLQVSHNDIADCGNNGIQIWRSEAGQDGSVIAGNRIVRIRADGGGSGQNGNGINAFRAGAVLVSGNRITDCAFSAVRGNASNNIQIIGNSCTRLGEVAIYSEFGFEGALIASNVVDQAATGITVTNFNEGGRLAVIQGNLVRNLFRREHEPVDKRGHGITAEADCAMTGNVIERAPTAGIVIGWGAYMRDVVATSNLVRDSRVGILISADPSAGACLVTGNMISSAKLGAVRAMNSEGEPVGADLVHGGNGNKRIAVSGNLSV